jgi:hypothetical protein
MVRSLALCALLGVTLFPGTGAASNQVTWVLHVGGASTSVVTLPAALFKDHPLVITSERWRCFADKALRQDEGGNTYSTLTVHCTDGETTVSSSASCQIGHFASDQLSLQFDEKATRSHNAIQAKCDG